MIIFYTIIDIYNTGQTTTCWEYVLKVEILSAGI